MSGDFKVLMYEKMHQQGTELLESRCRLEYANELSEDALVEQAADADAIIIRAHGQVSRRIIESAPKLKVIGRHGVGLDAIDLPAARENGVAVVYTPTANAESVAEHFFGLALTLAKKMRLGDIALRQGDWDARYRLIGAELLGKTRRRNSSGGNVCWKLVATGFLSALKTFWLQYPITLALSNARGEGGTLTLSLNNGIY